MTEADFRLAEALAIQRLHKGRAHVWIAGRLAALRLVGDEAGVRPFREIAKAYETLLRPTLQ